MLVDRHRVAAVIALSQVPEAERAAHQDALAALLVHLFQSATPAGREAFRKRMDPVPQSQKPWAALVRPNPAQWVGLGPPVPAVAVLVRGQQDDDPDSDEDGNRLPDRDSKEGIPWNPLYAALDRWDTAAIVRHVGATGWQVPTVRPVPLDEGFDVELVQTFATSHRSTTQVNPGEVFNSEVAALAKLASQYAALSPEAFAAKQWEALFLLNAALNGATEAGRAATSAELSKRWETEWKKEGIQGLGSLNPKWSFRTTDGEPPVIRIALDSALRNASRSLTSRVQLLQSIPPERRQEFTELVRVLYGDVAEFAGAANFDFIKKMKEISRATRQDDNWSSLDPWLMVLPHKGEPAPIEILLRHQVGKRADEEPTPEELALQARQGSWAHAIKTWDVTFLRDNPFSQLYRGVTETAKDVADGANDAAKNLAKVLAWAPYVAAGIGVLGLSTFAVAVARSKAKNLAAASAPAGPTPDTVSPEAAPAPPAWARWHSALPLRHPGTRPASRSR